VFAPIAKSLCFGTSCNVDGLPMAQVGLQSAELRGHLIQAWLRETKVMKRGGAQSDGVSIASGLCAIAIRLNRCSRYDAALVGS